MPIISIPCGLLRTTALATLAFASITADATPITWNATADYSLTQDTGVNGVWSYGSTGTALGGTFTNFSRRRTTAPLERWEFSTSSALIGKAIGGSYNAGSVRAPIGTLLLHPGAAGEFGVLRFVAPTAGSYKVDALFWASDTGTTSDAHIFATGTEYFSSLVTNADPYGGSDLGWTGTLQLTAGQFIDFAVSYGSNHTYSGDATGVSALVTKLDPVVTVPEPSSLLLLASGLGIAGLLRLHQRRSPG